VLVYLVCRYCSEWLFAEYSFVYFVPNEVFCSAVFPLVLPSAFFVAVFLVVCFGLVDVLCSALLASFEVLLDVVDVVVHVFFSPVCLCFGFLAFG
jgi:hypothetical protein